MWVLPMRLQVGVKPDSEKYQEVQLSHPPKSQARQRNPSPITNCLSVCFVSLPENRFTAKVSFFLLKPSASFTGMTLFTVTA